MSRHRARRPPPEPGLPPGTIRLPADAPAPQIHVFGYGPDVLDELAVDDVERLTDLRGRWPVLWVNVDGLGDGRVLERIGEIFGLHRLALEDVANTTQRPKVEVYPAGVYIVLRMVRWAEPAVELDSEQLSIFLGDGWVLTFQERSGDPFEPVRERVRQGRVLLRDNGADYLAYALVDAVVDHLFPVVQTFGDATEELEELVMDHPTRRTYRRVRQARHALIQLRRAVWPLRDAVSALQGEHVTLIKPETRVYLRDVLDHVLRVIDLVESSRDEVNGLIEGYQSALGFKMNEVMGLLTLVGTVFLPLSFLTGLYGMNFDRAVSPYNMPELGWRFGYLGLLAVMTLLTAALLLVFWRRGWFALTGQGRME